MTISAIMIYGLLLWWTDFFTKPLKIVLLKIYVRKQYFREFIFVEPFPLIISLVNIFSPFYDTLLIAWPIFR